MFECSSAIDRGQAHSKSRDLIASSESDDQRKYWRFKKYTINPIKNIFIEFTSEWVHYRVQLNFMPTSVVENDWFYLLNLREACYFQKFFLEKIIKSNHTDDNNDANKYS